MASCGSSGFDDNGNGFFRAPGSHANPYFNYTQQFTPRRLKDLFRFCEYLFYNSPHVYAALRKFGEYPITTVTYTTANEALKEKYRHLLEKVLHVREVLVQTTLDKYVYGNAFLSMYQPFVRHLECPNCKNIRNIAAINYKYHIQKLTFSYTCESCKSSVKATTKHIKDKKLLLPRKVNFIRWSPKDIDIDYNDITGESDYYYTIPQHLIQKVNAGNKSIIDTVPIGFLEAIKANKKFKFTKGAVFHMKTGGPAGLSQQWGLPPLLSVISKFHYTEVLRKANEAIALDYLTPFRVVHPQASSGNADPIMTAQMGGWADNMRTNMEKWRKDPLHIMFSPFPLGETQVGGNGRALLTLGEIQEAEKSMVAALGIPLEFLYGGLTGSGMEATLRLIENQLETHINDLKDLLQWVADRCGKFLGWDLLDVGMTKFRIVDDVNAKNMLYQMWISGATGQGPRIVSDDTIASMYDIDLVEEREKIKQEALNQAREDKELQQEMDDLQNNMAEQVRNELYNQDPTSNGGTRGYNQQQMLAEADQYVEQLVQMDEGTKRSELHKLQTEDYVFYSVVIQRLEQYNKQQSQNAG
jgi:hypothetical protein